MKSEEDVIWMLKEISLLPSGFTVHAIHAILNMILDRGSDSDEDIKYCKLSVKQDEETKK